MKETVEQRTILKKKIPKILNDCKNAVSVADINQFKRHTGSAFHGILVLEALEIASEKVRAFSDVILTRGKETQEIKTPAHKRKQEMEI